MKSLESICIGQGKLSSLSGIENFKHLKSVSIGGARNFTDIERLYKLKYLEDIYLEDLPNLTGSMDLSTFNNLNSIYVVNSPVYVDISTLHKLSSPWRIWLNVQHVNLKWQDLFKKPALKSIGLMKGKDFAYNDEDLRSIAKESGRSILSINHVGNKKSGQIQLELL